MDFDVNVKGNVKGNINLASHTCVRPGTDIVQSFGTSYSFAVTSFMMSWLKKSA